MPVPTVAALPCQAPSSCTSLSTNAKLPRNADLDKGVHCCTLSKAFSELGRDDMMFRGPGHASSGERKTGRMSG